MSTPTAVVVGGGLAGVSCAQALRRAGADVIVRERGRSLGGRMASRTLRGSGTAFDGRIVDIGASYFTVSDPGFADAVEMLERRGVVRPWATGFHVAGPEGIVGVSGGPVRYAAPRGLRSVVTSLAAGLADVRTCDPVAEVTWGPAMVVDGSEVDAIALCLPHPQAARIAPQVPDSRVTWEPVLAVTLVFGARSWLDLDGVFVNDDPVVTWIADDGSRRGDGAPVLVAHADPVLSARHLDDPATAIPAVVATVRRILGITHHPDWVAVHRWSYARPLVAADDPCWLADEHAVGLAGDAFAGGPRAEAAWVSGDRLGRALAARIHGGR